LATFTTTIFPWPSAAPRRMASSVPSIASTASTVFFFTTTVCPISAPEIFLAISKPKVMFSNKVLEGFFFPNTPGPGIQCLRRKVESSKRTSFS